MPLVFVLYQLKCRKIFAAGRVRAFFLASRGGALAAKTKAPTETKFSQAILKKKLLAASKNSFGEQFDMPAFDNRWALHSRSWVCEEAAPHKFMMAARLFRKKIVTFQRWCKGLLLCWNTKVDLLMQLSVAILEEAAVRLNHRFYFLPPASLFIPLCAPMKFQLQRIKADMETMRKRKSPKNSRNGQRPSAVGSPRGSMGSPRQRTRTLDMGDSAAETAKSKRHSLQLEQLCHAIVHSEKAGFALYMAQRKHEHEEEVSEKVVLWIGRSYCGSEGRTVDRKVVLWIGRSYCGSKGRTVDPTLSAFHPWYVSVGLTLDCPHHSTEAITRQGCSSGKSRKELSPWMTRAV
jgi:hypothetical protein